MPHDTLAVVFLIVVGAMPLAAGVWWSWRSAYGFRQSLLLLLCKLLVRLRWRAQVPPFPLPPGQGAILVCNHRSSVDPFFIQTVAGRVVHWMVAREFCEHPAFAWFLRVCEVIPVNRSGIDTKSTKHSIRLASSGELIGMFPEGRINMTDQLLLPGRPGAILVALKARVPILPCYIEGAPYCGTPWSPLFMSAKTAVRFGDLIDLSPYFDRQCDEKQVGELLRRAMKAIADLAGHKDFEPQIAGRRWKPTIAEIEKEVAAIRNPTSV